MNGKKIETIKISGDQAGWRIDKFLSFFYSDKSRTGWQRKIKNKEILVNDKIIKADYILKEGNEVKILKVSPVALHKKKEISEIEIIYEDNEVIVLSKPAGVLSQNAQSSKSPSVSDFLLEHYPKIKNVGEGEMRFGVVHRLDKDTSGVIIAAKNNRSFEFLKEQFKNRKTQKVYLALVYGNIKPEKGEIDFKIGRSKTNPNMQTAIDTKKKRNIKSREALTVYKTVKSFKNFSLLEVSPKTGRMHQIRVHLKAVGYPVVGDRKYFFKKYKNKNLELSRQFLHAGELKITLPNGKVKIFKSELAEDLKFFLEKME